jgi:DNA-binding protein H-NS
MDLCRVSPDCAQANILSVLRQDCVAGDSAAIGGDSMNRKTLESMSAEKLWNLHELITAILTEKISAEKLELNQRLQRLRRGTVLDDETDRPAVARRRRPYPRVLPKYRNPSNPAETWSGRGKMPRWLKAKVESGKAADDFLIS